MPPGCERTERNSAGDRTGLSNNHGRFVTLYLLRHGDAMEAGYDDAERPLSPLGEKQAAQAGLALQRLDIFPEIIISSPLERARQTAKAVQQILQKPEISTSEYLIPGTDQRQILELLNNISRQTVLLVGHEPQLSTFISSLVSGSVSARIVMNKGSLARLDTPRPIVQGVCCLRWLLTAEQLEKLLR